MLIKQRLPEFLKPLFWEVNFQDLDTIKRGDYVIKRILEYGDRRAVNWMRQSFNKAKIENVILKTRDLSPQSANYWSVVLGIDKKRVRCLQRHYLEVRKMHWPY